MSEGEQPTVYHPEPQSNVGKWILIALAIVYVGASAFFIYDQHAKLDKVTQAQAVSDKQIGDLTKRMQSAEADSETLAQQLGMTKKELATRAAELQRAQQAASASAAARIAAQAEEEKKDVGAVSGEVGAVKTDVGGVKTDVAATKASLEATIAKLQSTVGDLNVQSGLIANTRGDLEALKHKGDRQYYEFTLLKGSKPQAFSTVALQLKKTDPKRGKYSLDVTADDKTIEKKDRNQSEPVQFYTGRDHMLYELVVWTVDKNKVTGYLSTPKNAPIPAARPSPMAPSAIRAPLAAVSSPVSPPVIPFTMARASSLACRTSSTVMLSSGSNHPRLWRRASISIWACCHLATCSITMLYRRTFSSGQSSSSAPVTPMCSQNAASTWY